MQRKNLYASYDLSLNPLSFDFVNFLAIMRGLCCKFNLDEKFDLVIRAETLNRGGAGIEDRYPDFHKKQKFNNIILRVASLCTWINTFYVVRTAGMNISMPCAMNVPDRNMLEKARKESLPQWMVTPMTGKQLSNMIKSGGRIPDRGFVPNEFILKHYKRILGERSIVLHPRCSMFSENRNTPLGLFKEVADYFAKKGFVVVLVPDYEDFLNGFVWSSLGLRFEVSASLDIEHRVGIAQAATINLTWNGGFTQPLHFSDSKFLETGHYIKENLVTSLEYFERKGPEYGVQPNWLEPYQVYDWTEKSELNAEILIEKLELILKQ